MHGVVGVSVYDVTGGGGDTFSEVWAWCTSFHFGLAEAA